MPDWCIRFQVFTGILLLFSALSAGNTLAQNKPAATDGSESSQEQPVLDEFSPNPLNSTEPDPLLPNPPASNQVLSSDQQAGLIPALDQLNLEATAALANGNPIQAFTLWTRELRLRRYLGLLPEIEALSRVGLVAWNNGQRLYLKFITERLNEILQQAQPQAEVNLELLQRLGVAFEEVRAKESAVQTYQTLRETYRQQQAILAEERALDQVAAVYLSWLDYSNAAATYESLLELQQEVQSLRGTGALPSLPVPVEGENPQSAETDQPSQVKSLKNLAFIYEQLQQPLQAIAAKEKLVGFYLTQQNPQPIPDLKLSIGQDYEQLGQFQQAGQNYQEAYSLATTIQQFANASEALDRLAKLYRAQNRGETALELYQAQLLINQQSYNLYGMMNSYDNIGQIYFEQKAFQRALAAFQAGLELATQLKYGEDYF